MPTIAAFLIGLVTPLVKKVLIALGFGVVTYAAMTPLINSVISSAQSAFGGITGAVAGLAGLAGIPEVLGIFAGALVARVSFIAAGQIAKMAA